LRSYLQGKVDLSGVVQQTLLDAHTAGAKFPAGDPVQARSWLAAVFRNRFSDAVRRTLRKKSDVRREVPLDACPGPDAAPLADRLPADGSTPSERAARSEQADRLARALAGLRPDQRQAVELHYLHGQTVEQVAAALGKSKMAVAGLLKRGLQDLRGRLTDPRTAG
ncbi:MAG TPA: sigma-70 family RNA polymerase sigma factor, partial [Gemmataceae bacterium]|nr:sigma-70 family RNA polymerase sigma factor [Gemmataceae bacterium]